MYELIKTEAIVLKKRPYQEKDSWIEFFTDKLGRISLLAKSIRDNKSKISGKLELFSIVELELQERKHLSIRGVKVKKYHDNLEKDLNKFSLAAQMSETCIQSTAEHEYIPGYFDILKDSLLFLDQNTKGELINIFFKIQSLVKTGYIAQQKHCHYCREKISQNSWLDLEKTLILCHSCQNQSQFHQNHPIDLDSLKLFNYLQSAELRQVKQITLPNSEIFNQIELLISYLNHLDNRKELQSNKFRQNLKIANQNLC